MTVGKDVSKGDVKRTGDGPSFVEGTQLGNFKRSDNGTSFAGSTQSDMSYAEVASKR